MKILYLGSCNERTTSGHRANALIRLCHQVDCVDIPSQLRLKGLTAKFHYQFGYRYLQKNVLLILRQTLKDSLVAPDVIWVDGGQYFGPDILSWLKHVYTVPIILYNIDDPTGARDSCQFHSLKAALPFYSLCVFVRQETALEALALCAKKVLTVSRSFDEAAHFGHAVTCELNQTSDNVAFIGTNIPGENRDQFLMDLFLAGCPIKLIGDRWRKSRFWSQLKLLYVANEATGLDYVSVIKASTACLGFLSHQNRDLITTRSLEITACSGLFCAERTSEHQLYYEDQMEALFWIDSEECVQVISRLLADYGLRADVRDAGAKHVVQMGVGNEDMCRHVLSVVVNMTA